MPGPTGSPATPPTGGAPSALPDGTARPISIAADDRTPRPVDDAVDAAGRKPIIRTIQPRSKDDASSGPVDILDLPRASGGADATRGAAASGNAGSVRLASGAESLPSATDAKAADSVAKTANASAAALYGYEPNYAWLRGKLEYSQVDRQWKLRYIPVEGDNDDYGGSVVLSNSAALSGYERGDLVEVHGRVQSQQAKKGFAPLYEVADIKPLRRATP
jgi:hypothetical protein